MEFPGRARAVLNCSTNALYCVLRDLRKRRLDLIGGVHRVLEGRGDQAQVARLIGDLPHMAPRLVHVLGASGDGDERASLRAVAGLTLRADRDQGGTVHHLPG